MSLTRAIAGNTAVQVAGKFTGVLLSVFTVAIMTRHLGRAGYGEFTTAISFLQFFGILVDFGFTLTMIKMISEPDADERRIVANIFTLRVISGVFFFGLAALVAQFFPYTPAVRLAIAVGSLSFLCVSLSQIFTGVFQKKLAVRLAAIAEVAGRGALFLGVFFAARAGAGLIAIVAILAASNILQLVLSLVFARQLVSFGWAADLGLWREIFRQSWPIGLAIVFNLVYLKGDVIILSLFRSRAEVGLYGAAYKVLDVITILPTVFMGLVLPVLASVWTAGDRQDFNRKLSRAFEFLSILAIPLVFGTIAVARDVMILIAGPEFAAAGPLLAILMAAGAMVFWSALYGHTIVAIGLQRRMLWGYGLNAAISLALYFLLIPRHGAVAAAWVTLFSEAFMFLATAFVVIRATGSRPDLRIWSRSLAASVIMLGGLWGLAGLPVLPRVAIGIITYLAFLFIFGGISTETIRPFLKPSSDT
ncbi:MAG: flippase [Patescibacteria group bacterium]|jgi:O-antigen/teichoic acid export membrane protein